MTFMRPTTRRDKTLGSIRSMMMSVVSIILITVAVNAPEAPERLPVIDHEIRQEYTDVQTLIKPIIPIRPIEPEEVKQPEILISDEEIELIALVTMAEAEGECEEGKRLVIDTVLNRVDSNRWPNTITEVIYQPHQFTSMWNGRVDRCYVRDDICKLVREELVSRTNSEVVFFTAGGYGRYGTPVFQVGNHYFCKL